MAKRPPLQDLVKDLTRESGKASAPEVSEPKGKKPYAPPSRQGKVAFAVHVLPAVKAQVKVIAAEQGRTVESIWAEGMNHVFQKYGKKPIA